MLVLVINAGSSSLKYQLLDSETSRLIAKGNCERIGIDGIITHKMPGKDTYTKNIDMPNHAQATKILVQTLTSTCIKSMNEIGAVGHRIVHGGAYFSQSVRVDDEVINKLEKCLDIAPLHTAAHLMGIRGCLEVMPDTPQVLVFDTAFHATMPPHAYTYPIPSALAEKYKIRRYGFHGTSHRYVTAQALKMLDKPAEDTRIITCHLGNGSSISAVKGGKVIDTSMGFTPLDGLIMGSRCGSIDPAIVTFMCEKLNMSPSDMNNYLNKNCGLMGVSELSSDCRDLESAMLEGNKQAKLAMNILVYQIKKLIGSYIGALNGADAVVFTAGIGENRSLLREKVCENMDFFGIKLDKELNAKTVLQSDNVDISDKNSAVRVFVIPTNEELLIAQDTANLIGKK
ncbi:MAG: acetate kinase [Ruminococcaceae bacterium]|nr:acetate kinase [Oscillospiraceae bacterium]